MSERPFRFLQASDLELHRCLDGLDEIPAHLRETFADAPLDAARQVFDTALVEDVDFVVLAGGVLDPELAGPRAMSFLLEQFERLRDRGIAVYWAGGPIDAPVRWPADVRLPDSVHRFPADRTQTWIHKRNDEPVARLVGRSREDEGPVDTALFRVTDDGPFTLAVSWGELDARSAAVARIDAWALGGRRRRATPREESPRVHYSGAPQAFSSRQTGAHGCSLVHVDNHRRVRVRGFACDAVRRVNETVRLGKDTPREKLEQLFLDRLRGIAGDAAGRQLLVTWRVEARGRLGSELRRGKLGRELLAWLREQGRPQKVWSVKLDFGQPPAPPEEWLEEDTILGDFLRAVRQHEDDPAMEFELDRFLSQRNHEHELLKAAKLGDPKTRKAVLREVASLGADLLRGELKASEPLDR